MAKKIMLIMSLACGLTACTPELPPKVAQGIEDVTEAISTLDPLLRAVYQIQLTACPDDACADKVKAAWEKPIEALQKVREGWCTIKPEACDE